MPIFSDYDIEHSYYNSDALVRIQRLIADHSTNKQDIRDVAFSDIDFEGVDHILDLGCAFGYSILGLKERIRPGTHIVGFDLQESYQRPFLKACREVGANGEFHISDVAELATFPPHSFDLVISSFSMYFFPDSLAHIAGVLKREGVFVAITHSEDILRELIIDIASVMDTYKVQTPEVFCIQRLFQEFSCENGREILTPHFGSISCKPFDNKLQFAKEDLGKFVDYVEMKKHLFFKEVYEQNPDNVTSVLENVMAVVAEKAEKKEWVDFNKNDCIFICREPQHGSETAPYHTNTPTYCSSCSHEITEKKIEGKKRSFCVQCGYIDYKNPLPVAAAVVPNSQGEILLVRRANHPMRGMWCLPCGFAEIDEEMSEAALRELEEETGLLAEQCTLLDVSNSHNYFYGNLLMVSYLVHSTQGSLRPGDDAMDTRYFAIDDMPPLAFRSHEKALRLFRSRDIETGEDKGKGDKLA